MQCLKSNKLLKYHPNTMEHLRMKYQLNKPGEMDNAVDILENWIQQQSHFMKKDFSREYLERVIILLKGSVERAKSQLDKICTLRTLLPQFFQKHDPKNDFKNLQGYVSHSFLPLMTEDHYRIFFVKFAAKGAHSAKMYNLLFQCTVMICEYIKHNDYCDGLIAVCDMRGVNIIEFTTELNINELRQMVAIGIDGYGSRLKGVHILSTSNTINVLVAMLKQVVPEKIGSRIHVHKNIEDLHKHMPKEILPVEYGGKERSLDELNELLYEVLATEENIECLKSMRKACTDESLRPVATFNEQYMGMAGTFRTLNVD